jgi:diadenosine tetraphosphatase ApaH/serine/threonine PP2A family protein phosphatase
MKIAVFSDVHANLPALEAVLEAIDQLAPDRILCLGDLVGYGAEPAACIRTVRAAADVVLLGNHDRDSLAAQAAQGTNSLARLTQAWTREQLGPEELAYLEALPSKTLEPYGVVAVHGCYLNDVHVTGYVTSTMLPDNLQAVAAREGWPRIALCGHTHLPLCGWLLGNDTLEPKIRGRLVWPAKARAVLINPGAVGQPRDGDPRAAFALLDLERRTVEIHRVRYDIDRAAEAIQKAGLPASLGERLREGR